MQPTTTSSLISKMGTLIVPIEYRKYRLSHHPRMFSCFPFQPVPPFPPPFPSAPKLPEEITIFIFVTIAFISLPQTSYILNRTRCRTLASLLNTFLSFTLVV